MSAPDAAGPEVVAGHPTPEEVAAVMAALSAVLAAARQSRQGKPATSVWASRARLLPRPPAPGPDAWHRSARP